MKTKKMRSLYSQLTKTTKFLIREADSSELFLLDTHVWLWIVRGEHHRMQTGLMNYLDLLRRESKLQISVISVWEVGILAAKNKIQLSKEYKDWIDHAISTSGVSVVGLTPEIAIESVRLPGEFHNDPADRFLVATARVLNATLVTQDKQILNYSRQGFLNSIPLSS